MFFAPSPEYGRNIPPLRLSAAPPHSSQGLMHLNQLCQTVAPLQPRKQWMADVADRRDLRQFRHTPEQRCQRHALQEEFFGQFASQSAVTFLSIDEQSLMLD